MVIETERWGAVDVDDDRRFAFADGLLGFPGLTVIAVLDDGDVDDVVWLQSLDDPTLGFSAIVPWGRFPHYQPVLPLEDQLALALEDEDEAIVFCLLAGDERAGRGTANLLAPLVVNRTTRCGRQVVLFDSAWPLRAPLAA